MLCSDLDLNLAEFSTSPMDLLNEMESIDWSTDALFHNSVSLSMDLACLPAPISPPQLASTSPASTTSTSRNATPAAAPITTGQVASPEATADLASSPQESSDLATLSALQTSLASNATVSSMRQRMPASHPRNIVQPRHVSDSSLLVQRQRSNARYSPYARNARATRPPQLPSQPHIQQRSATVPNLQAQNARRQQTHELRLLGESNGVLRYYNPLTGDRYVFCKNENGKDPIFLPALSRVLFGSSLPFHGRAAASNPSGVTQAMRNHISHRPVDQRMYGSMPLNVTALMASLATPVASTPQPTVQPMAPTPAVPNQPSCATESSGSSFTASNMSSASTTDLESVAVNAMAAMSPSSHPSTANTPASTTQA